MRQVVERSKHHAVAVYDDLVLTYAYRGAEADPLHITTTAEAVLASRKRTGHAIGLVFIIAEPDLSQPPSAAVREAIHRWTGNYVGNVGLAVVVIPGRGVASTLHRSVVRAFAALFLRTSKLEVTDSVRDALVLHGLTGPALDDALRFCEQTDGKRQ